MTFLDSLLAKVRRRPSRTCRPARLRAMTRLAVEHLESRDLLSAYSIIDLGTLGGSNSYAFGISEQGQVVGTAQTAVGVNRAFLWQNGVMTDLGTPHASTARGVNQAGQVVGVDIASSGEASTSTAFLWEDGGLDLFASQGGASAINELGQTVGQYQPGLGQPSHAFLYQDGTLMDLGTLGGAISQAQAINNTGQVVGSSQYTSSPFFHAFLWQDGVLTDLGQLGSDPESSFAYGTNDAGVVVGLSGNAAFVYDSNGMRDLNVPTAFSAVAYDINNVGQIVGASSTYAYIIDVGSGVTDLNSLIPEGTDWSLTSATAINDAGQIVGTGWRGGLQHAFLLNPIDTDTLSLWSDSFTPSGQISDGPVELGVRFQADVSGFINGIRFHKGPQNTGTHVGNLWTEDGELLATALFTAETASGWQQITFDMPVAIQADTTYIASYHTDTGYAFDHFYFDSPWNNGPLTATGGVYAYGPGGFPTESFQASNYWVDVLFSPGAVPPPAPEGAQAIGGSPDQVTVAWLASPGATSYNIYRSTMQGGQGSVPYQTGVIGVPSNGFTVYIDTNVTNGTTYYYQISAVNEAGEGDRSNEVGATPIGPVSGNIFSLFDPSLTPTIAAANDTNPVELGVRFYSDIDGFITSIRFYRGEAIDSGYVVNLWTEDGTLLRTANVIEGQGPTPGWQQVSFAPVAITAGTTYVASYFASAGEYAFDFGYFESGVNSGPLHAPAGDNGVYTYGPGGGFPNQTYNSSNYWVDVVFQVPPVAPSVSASAGDGQVTLSWNEVGGAASYNIYRSTTPGGEGATPYATRVVGASFTDTNVTNGTTYYYQVSGVTPGLPALEGERSAEISATPAATEYSLWDDATTPTVAAALDDTNPVEVGVRFRSDVDGFITSIRFYRGVAIDSGYTVHLWSSDGALLATGVVIEGQSPAPGWQEVSIPPVAITAGTTYVASYYASSGQYAYDHDYFAAGGVDRGPLHILADGEEGGNGVYFYGTGGGFPNQSYRSSNYWVDVVFKTQL